LLSENIYAPTHIDGLAAFLPEKKARIFFIVFLLLLTLKNILVILTFGQQGTLSLTRKILTKPKGNYPRNQAWYDK